MQQIKISCDIQRCGSISFSPTVYSESCTNTTNAKCSCRKGFLCSNEDCSQCVEQCPAGERMKRPGERVPEVEVTCFCRQKTLFFSLLPCIEHICKKSVSLFMSIEYFLFILTSRKQISRNVWEQLWKFGRRISHIALFDLINFKTILQTLLWPVVM